MTVCWGFRIYYQHRVLHLSEDVVNNENLNDVYAAKLSIFSNTNIFCTMEIFLLKYNFSILSLIEMFFRIHCH